MSIALTAKSATAGQNQNAGWVHSRSKMHHHLVLVLVAIVVVHAPLPSQSLRIVQRRDTIQPEVRRALREKPNHNVIVQLDPRGWDKLHEEIARDTSGMSRVQKLEALHTALKAHSRGQQEGLKELLRHENWVGEHDASNTTYFSLFNAISIPAASRRLIERLGQHRDVHKVHSDSKIRVHDRDTRRNVTGNDMPDGESILQMNREQIEKYLKEHNIELPKPTSGLPHYGLWGLQRIRADQAQTALNAYGEGSIVGVIDSGLGMHDTFDSRVIDYMDTIVEPYLFPPELIHGTHVAATAVGGNGIGVAPKAKLVACRAFKKLEFDLSNVMKCMQFMICPSKICSHTPHVINHSYSLGPRDGNFDIVKEMIDKLNLANILNVFSAGNIDKKYLDQDDTGICARGRVSFPADFPQVLAVGSFDKYSELAKSSRQGARNRDVLKPEISAPGVDIYSAYPEESKYVSLEGTSMAAPHVTGVAALVFAILPEATNEQVREILIVSSRRDYLKPPLVECALSYNTFPNIGYGFGAVDAKNAVMLARHIRNEVKLKKGATIGSILKKLEEALKET